MACFLAASEQALVGSDQAREAFQTTQRTFLSVELQGKLYATVARYSQDRAPRKQREQKLLGSQWGILALCHNSDHERNPGSLLLFIILFIIKETQQLIERIRERKCSKTNMQGASSYSVLISVRELCKLSLVMTKFYKNVGQSA
jgi:hypothetical protein